MLAFCRVLTCVLFSFSPFSPSLLASERNHRRRRNDKIAANVVSPGNLSAGIKGEGGKILTTPSSASTPDSAAPPAHLPCPPQIVPASERAAPVLASAAPAARGASRSGGRNCEGFVLAVNSALFRRGCSFAAPRGRRPDVARSKDRKTPVPNERAAKITKSDF